jgi:HPt (histidine-containing phosphotransfer) domain-containing protein
LLQTKGIKGREAGQPISGQALSRAAHALKSMSYNVGARRFAGMAAQLEQDARVEGRVASADDIEALTTQLAKVRAELQRKAA